MLIAFSVIVCALVFLAALPVRLGVLKLPDHPLRLGAALGLIRIQTDVYFELQDGTAALELRFRRHTRVLPLTRETLRPSNPPPIKNALRYLKRRLRCDRLDLEADIALGDAALTAPAAALLYAALNAVHLIFPNLPLRSRISCTFSGAGRARALGIVSLRGGHIMIAALIFGRDVITRRLQQWISTPSKPS